MADINKNDVVHIAKLAMLNLSDEEIEKYATDLQEILGYAEMINNVDTSKVNEVFVGNEQKNVFRKDEVQQFESRELLLKNAPTQMDGMFNLPKIIN